MYTMPHHTLRIMFRAERAREPVKLLYCEKRRVCLVRIGREGLEFVSCKLFVLGEGGMMIGDSRHAGAMGVVLDHAHPQM